LELENAVLTWTGPWSRAMSPGGRSFRQFLQASLNLGEVGDGEVRELGGFEVNLRFDILQLAA
jgi:hypothetical protein